VSVARNVRLAAPACVALALLASIDARGDVPPNPAPTSSSALLLPPITIAAVPAFGAESTGSDGWSEIVVRVESISASPVRGTLEVKRIGSTGYRGGDGDAFVASAPFNVAAGQSVVVRIPTHSIAAYAATVTVRALTEAGAVLAESNVTVATNSVPLLVDVEPTPKLAVAMRAWPVTPSWAPTHGYAYYGSPTASIQLTTGGPVYDKVTGDPILPDRAAAYASATVVVLHSDVLARLAGVELEALVDWVATGGELAVVVARPEDLRIGTLTALLGGVATTAQPSPALFAFPAVERPASAPSPFYEPELFQPGDSKAPTPIGYFEPTKGTPPKSGAPFRVGPLPALRDKLVGFAGGNLRPSPYGASAPYGLGEVHLLAFDPTVPPAIDDGWSDGRLLDLIDHAWDRRSRFVFPHGSGDLRGTNVSDVRRLLDPNENFRIALGISALLLVIYSVLAGPLTYIRATKKGRPLDPLVFAPMWSAIAFGLILFIGLAGKGFRGRARRIAVVEAGAGMQRGAIRRYRGFFSSQTRQLSVRASDRTSVLDTVATESREHGDAAMSLDRDGARLENLTALPWQTVVVAEDAMFDLPKGGVSITPASDGSVDVSNHTGRALAHVAVWVPREGVYSFPALADGATLHASAGKLIASASSISTATAGGMRVRLLDATTLAATLSGTDATSLTEQWAPLSQAAGYGVDWFPDDAAVLMAEITGGEGVLADAGLAVERDTLLLRVVGEGGAP
jgi:hypothetical protein